MSDTLKSARINNVFTQCLRENRNNESMGEADYAEITSYSHSFHIPHNTN